MRPFEITTSHVEERGHFEREPPYGRADATELTKTSPAETDPHILVDGINSVRIVREDDATYLIHYRGFATGYLRVDEAGMREFGETCLADEQGIPRWYLNGEADESTDRPWWVPDSYTPTTSVDCVRCHTAVPTPEVVTPGREKGDVVDWFCRDCWEEVRDAWSPEWEHAGEHDTHRARYLDHTVGGQPDQADIDELVALIDSDSETAQMHALTAMGRLLPKRAADIRSVRPVLVDNLDSDPILTRFGALNCLTQLAEADVEAVLPVINDVLPLLDPSSDGGIHEEAIRFVAAVSREYPTRVREAVPGLITLLEHDLPIEAELLEAVVHIAEAEPESVEPVADELYAYVDDETADHRVSATAALGYVAKDFPAVAETTIPTMVDFLDAPNDQLRANAAGLLADFSEEYPEELLSAVPEIRPLVDDTDEHAQHNATYILAQMASHYPAEVEPAVDELIDALDAEQERTRANACRALGYIDAKRAIEPLEVCRKEDSSVVVQQMAGWALGQFSNTS